MKTQILLYTPQLIRSKLHSPVNQRGRGVSYFSAWKEIEAVNSAAEIARQVHIEVGT